MNIRISCLQSLIYSTKWGSDEESTEEDIGSFDAYPEAGLVLLVGEMFFPGEMDENCAVQ